ncbi:MAG: energy-coupling factor ABC transporter permease [Anaerolineae bacterium]|nr:energy-coupling factor ABC transporter permease [Anaerolineae bacterium]
MHIPDGFLSTPVAVGSWAVSTGAVGYAARRAARELGDRQVPLMGVSGAFIFAAQMLNFPVAGGTSGHLLGGALAAILLGPWQAALALTAVLGVQALLFQDGGLLVLGANVLNMAVVGVLTAWLTYRAGLALLGSGRTASLVSTFVAAWLSVVVASLLAAVELALSGAYAAGAVLTAMGGVHLLIGLGEGLITTAVIAFVTATRPGLLALQPARA